MKLLSDLELLSVTGAISTPGDYVWGIGSSALATYLGLGPFGSAAAAGMSIAISDFVKAYDPYRARIPVGIVTPSWVGRPSFTPTSKPPKITYLPGSSTPWLH